MECISDTGMPTRVMAAMTITTGTPARTPTPRARLRQTESTASVVAGAPRLAVFETRVLAAGTVLFFSRSLLPYLHLQDAAVIDSHPSGFPTKVGSKATPWPLFRLQDESALDRILVHET